MQEKLSVIIPVYNSEKYLKRALDSVLGQSFPVYEVICVDDGSQDGSLRILNDYAKQDARIKVLHKENGGPTSARKMGISKAGGAYVAFVDSDDYIEFIMYEEMMALAVKYDADLVTSGFVRDYGDSMVVNDETITKGLMSCLIDTNSFYRTGISPSLCNKIFKIDKLKSVQMKMDDRIFMWEDDAVIYSYLFRSRRVVVSGKSYYHYCVRETGSIMGSNLSDRLELSMELLLDYLEREFRNAQGQGANLMKQYQILKTSYLMMKCAPRVLRYDGEVLYPFGRIQKEGRILLYGAGKLGMELKSFLERQGFLIVGWVDKSAERPGVIRPDEIHMLNFDYVIITVLIADVAQHIWKDLMKLGVPKYKILSVDVKMITSATVFGV